MSMIDSASPTVAGFEKELHKKEQRLNDEMLTLAKRAETQNYNQLFAQKPNYYNTLLEQEGLALLIYENDTLKFWSDNSIAFDNWMKEVCLDTKMVKLQNGWFEVMRPVTNASTSKAIIGLILIKNEYPYQNKYLVNEFQKDFAVPAETKLSIIQKTTVKTGISNQVKNSNHDYLFSLEFNLPRNSIVLNSYFSLVFNLLGFIFLILFLKKSAISLKSNTTFGGTVLLLFAVTVILLRNFTIKYSIPAIFYDFELFSPKVYADASSIWLTSLGDLLINTVLLFFLTYFFIKEYKVEDIVTRFKRFNKLALSLISLLIFFGFSFIITSLFAGLITNSNIPFSINNLFSINQYSFIALIIIGLILFIYFLFADRMVSVLKQFQLSKKQYILVFLIASVVHTTVSHLFGILDLIIVFWPLAIIAIIALIKQKQTGYSFSGIVFLVFLFSFYVMHIFVNHTNIKEIESRKVYAEKLTAEEDPVAEFLFQEIEEKLKTDSVLISYISGPVKRKTEFDKRIRQEYFSGFWEKYDVRIALFDSLCRPVIKSQNILINNNLYFDELIENKGFPTSC